MNKAVTHNGFIWMGRELRRRLVEPARHFSFWGFLVFGIIIFGGSGFWFECAKHYFSAHDNSDAIRTALVTFAPAVAGFASLQIIADKNAKQQWRLSGGLCIAILALTAGWLTFDHSMRAWLGFIYAGLFAAFAIVIWWVGNADELFLQDETDPAAPVGGDTDAPPVGDVSNFKV